MEVKSHLDVLGGLSPLYFMILLHTSHGSGKPVLNIYCVCDGRWYSVENWLAWPLYAITVWKFWFCFAKATSCRHISTDCNVWIGASQQHYDGDLSHLAVYFVVTDNEYGEQSEVELLPGGKDIQVTNANVIKYIHLVANHRLNTQVRSLLHSWTYFSFNVLSLFSSKGYVKEYLLSDSSWRCVIQIVYIFIY